LAYIPFLFGPRGCIGQVFARAEMRCLLAAYVERFQFEMFDPSEELSVAGAVRKFLPCRVMANFVLEITIKPRALKLRVNDLGSRLKKA
jgi:cytochrome P450